MTIQNIISDYQTGKINLEDAEIFLVQFIDKTYLAEFIMDAYNRGWISNFNLGLDEDGNII